MNTETARQLFNETACLVELASTFQAAYGKNTRVKPASARDVWAIYHDLCNAQHRIAALLDPEALETPVSTYGEWWKRQDVPDMGTANALVMQASQLIAACAHFNVSNNGLNFSRTVVALQSAIAGILHPSVIQQVRDEALQREVS